MSDIDVLANTLNSFVYTGPGRYPSERGHEEWCDSRDEARAALPLLVAIAKEAEHRLQSALDELGRKDAYAIEQYERAEQAERERDEADEQAFALAGRTQRPQKHGRWYECFHAEMVRVDEAEARVSALEASVQRWRLSLGGQHNWAWLATEMTDALHASPDVWDNTLMDGLDEPEEDKIVDDESHAIQDGGRRARAALADPAPKEPPTVRDLIGLVPDLTGSLSAEEYVRSLRGSSVPSEQNARPPSPACGIVRIQAAEAKASALEAAVRWALGEGDSDFPSRGEGDPPYWWRKELRRRAALAAPDPNEGTA